MIQNFNNCYSTGEEDKKSNSDIKFHVDNNSKESEYSCKNQALFILYCMAENEEQMHRRLLCQIIKNTVLILPFELRSNF